MKLKILLTTLLITTSLSVNAKWTDSNKGLYHIINLQGARIIDISSQAFEYPKVITSISIGKKFYRCISWVRDNANTEPEPEKCWLLTPDD